MGFGKPPGGAEPMSKRHYLMATVGAVLMLLLDLLAFPFLFGYGAAIARPVFYAPMQWGEQLIVWAEQHLGLSVPSGSMSTFSPGVSIALLVFNWCCYTALGFLAGLLVGRMLWKNTGR